MFGFLKKKPDEPVGRRASRLEPRIKHEHFFRHLLASGVPPDQLPLAQKFCGELYVTYAFDLPDHLEMATPPLLQEVNVTPNDLPDVAMSNLMRELKEPKFVNKDGVQFAHTGGGREAVMLLFSGLWNHLQPQFNGEIVATVPRRDSLLLCGSRNAEGLAELRRATRQVFESQDDAHRLSQQVMVWRDGAWRLFVEQ